MYQRNLDPSKKHILILLLYCMLLMTLTMLLNGCGREEFPIIEEEVEGVYHGTEQEESQEITDFSQTTPTAEKPVAQGETNGINELDKFSDIAEYNGVIYQNVQLGNYAQQNWVKLPVDSSSFTVTNNKIYYLTGTDWYYYFGDPITYSLHCCNLDGSNDRCLLEVQNCQMGYAGICGNRLVGQFYLDEQSHYFMIDLSSEEVKDISMALDEGAYGDILGMDDEHLYYMSEGRILRCDFAGVKREVLYEYSEDFDTVGSLNNITLFDNNIYAFQLTNIGTVGMQDTYTYQLAEIPLDGSGDACLLPCEVTGMNATSFQILYGCLYHVRDHSLFQYSFESENEVSLTKFQVDTFGTNIRCMDDQGVYCIIYTEIDDTTHDDCYCIRIKEDNTYDIIDGWYVP